MRRILLQQSQWLAMLQPRLASLDENKANNSKAAIFDLATSIDIDDVNVAEGLD